MTQNTLLIAPRRFGKTTRAIQVAVDAAGSGKRVAVHAPNHHMLNDLIGRIGQALSSTTSVRKHNARSLTLSNGGEVRGFASHDVGSAIANTTFMPDVAVVDEAAYFNPGAFDILVSKYRGQQWFIATTPDWLVGMMDRVYCFYVLHLGDPTWDIQRYDINSAEYDAEIREQMERRKEDMSDAAWQTQFMARFQAEVEGRIRIYYADGTDERTSDLSLANHLIIFSDRDVQRITEGEMVIYERGVTTRKDAARLRDVLILRLIDMEART